MDLRQQEPAERQMQGQDLEGQEGQLLHNLVQVDTKGQQEHKVQQGLTQNSCCRQVVLVLERHMPEGQRKQGPRRHRTIDRNQEHRKVEQR